MYHLLLRDELVVDNYKGTKVDAPSHAAKDTPKPPGASCLHRTSKRCYILASEIWNLANQYAICNSYVPKQHKEPLILPIPINTQYAMGYSSTRLRPSYLLNLSISISGEKEDFFIYAGRSKIQCKRQQVIPLYSKAHRGSLCLVWIFLTLQCNESMVLSQYRLVGIYTTIQYLLPSIKIPPVQELIKQ